MSPQGIIPIPNWKTPLTGENFASSIKFKLDSNNFIKLSDECRFEGLGFNESWEIGECSMATQLIPHCLRVLEIGGGFGKVSHVINRILRQRSIGSQHVVVEGLEKRVKQYLSKNKENFKDEYTILNKKTTELKSLDLSVLKGAPDCLFVDCDNCLLQFLNTEIGNEVLGSVKFIANEMDGSNKLLQKLWSERGFRKVADSYGCSHARPCGEEIHECVSELWEKII